MSTRSILAFALVAGTTLFAQSLKPGLSLIPATVDNVEIYPRPVELEAGGKALQSFFKGAPSFIALEPKVGLSPKELGPGVVFVADFPAPKPAPDAKVGQKAAPTPFLAVLPTLRGKGLLRRLKAKEVKGVWSYALPADSGGKAEWRFAILKPGFLVVASDRKALESALGAKETLAGEVDATLENWLLSHDTADLWSAQSTRSGLAGLVAEFDKPRTGAQAAFASAAPRIRGLAAKAQASILHVALGIDLPVNGSVRVAARAFYRPGSPLAQDAAALAPLGAHPLANLPQDPFALAFGGQWPEVFAFFASDPDVALAAYKGHPLPEDLKARFIAAMKAQADQVQSMAMLIAPPSKAGESLLHGAVSVLRVKDAAAYQAAQERVTALQAEMAEAAGLQAYTSMEKDVLPGTPSFTLTTDLEKAPGAQDRDPQASMVFGFLFDGTVVRQSYGQLDPHTWLSVFGSGEDLNWALLRAKQADPLPGAPLLKREDELLPPGSRFSLYLDLKGLRDMAQMVVTTMGKGQEQLPVVPHVPPFGLACLCDAGGFEIRGGVQPETMKALHDFFEKMPVLMPQPQTHPQEPGTTE